MARENKPRLSNVVQGHFGTPHLRVAGRMADALEDVARFIRTDQCQIEPTGFLLVLKGDAGEEVLHVGIKTKDAIREIARSIKIKAES